MQKKIQIGEIVERSKKLEAMLKDLKAEGRGMHELLTSVEDKLDPELVKKLRSIAAIRNKAIHEPDFDIDGNIEVFNSTCDEAEKLFRKAGGKKRKRRTKKAPPKPTFNILFLLPFIPGLNLLYYIFLLVLSILPGIKYITISLIYALAFAGLAYGIIKNSSAYIISSLIVLAMLYVYNIFIASSRYPKLRYMPLLNIIAGFGKIKSKIHWSLFFASLHFTIFTILALYLIYKDIYAPYALIFFFVIYVNGILHFLYSGRRKQKTLKK